MWIPLSQNVSFVIEFDKKNTLSITVVARSKTVLDRKSIGVAGSSPTRGVRKGRFTFGYIY
jgi:hypothetical protein